VRTKKKKKSDRKIKGHDFLLDKMTDLVHINSVKGDFNAGL
jgi:hypothetical protein